MTVRRSRRVAVVFALACYFTNSEAMAQGWAATGPMPSIRRLHAATMLPSGRVLITGGQEYGGYVTSTALYDPVGNAWSAASPMVDGRSRHTATLLASGQVFVAGGTNHNINGELASAELYNPTTGSWTVAGSMATARYGHTATLLPSGKVLVADPRLVPHRVNELAA